MAHVWRGQGHEFAYSRGGWLAGWGQGYQIILSHIYRLHTHSPSHPLRHYISTLLNHYPSLFYTSVVSHSTIHPLIHYINPAQSLSIPFLLALLLTQPSTHSSTISTLLNQYPHILRLPITHSTTTRLPSTLLNHLATHLLISYLHT